MATQQLTFQHRFQPGTSDRTLLLLHGTGGDEHQLVALGHELAPDAALLSPRGQVREGGQLNRFFARRAVGDLDLEDLAVRTDDLAAFVAAAAEAYDLDPANVTALGFSNGANIAVSTLLRRPGVLAGAALWRPMLPFEPEPGLDLSGTDVLIGAGTHDPYSSPAQTAHLAEVLQAAGAAVQVATQRAGHELTQADIDAARVWLNR